MSSPQASQPSRSHGGKHPRWLRWAPYAILLVVALIFAKPVFLVVRAWWRDQPGLDSIADGFTDDASRLNQTPVAEVWNVPEDPEEAEQQLRDLLKRARHDQLNVAIAGARHSMGGHTISPGGIILNMLPFRRMELNPTTGILRVGAGARWADILPYLDDQAFSVAIMQSNNDFSVGGSISVNCHGWQHDRPPIASSVEAVRLMKADGTIVPCSRTQNAELFALVLGGYGLFGIILDVDLRVVPNEAYRAEVKALAAKDYPAAFHALARHEIGMIYGRLCVVPGKDFLQHAILTTFHKTKNTPPRLAEAKAFSLANLRRDVFRAQIDSKAGKELRWQLEKLLGDRLAGKIVSRNQLLNESSDAFREKNSDRTDILQEYFIPPEKFEAFLVRARDILPRHPVDLMNVTVRNVLEDRDTILRYADRELFSLVMLFNQPRTEKADDTLADVTRELIDAALECDGRYYLPYRLHATVEQFHRAYPMATTFFGKRERYDPDGLFQNQFLLKYGPVAE